VPRKEAPATSTPVRPPASAVSAWFGRSSPRLRAAPLASHPQRALTLDKDLEYPRLKFNSIQTVRPSGRAGKLGLISEVVYGSRADGSRAQRSQGSGR